MGYVILALIIILLAVILVRTAAFKPKPEAAREYEEISVDTEKVISNLQTLVRFRTVSFTDRTKEDNAEFRKLIDALPGLYPNVFRVCEYTEMSERALLFRWPGKTCSGKPSVMMAHFDVVPVEEENWSKPAFDGILEDGVLWGRGTLDTKVTFNGILTAADTLIAQGFAPEDDIYFAFSGQEEVNGIEAADIVTWFEERNIELEMVVDEGGAVVEGVFPGVSEPCGLIGISEKGLMNLTLTLKGNGGHASAPAPHTPVGELSKACVNIENHPMPMHITKPAAEMFDTLGRHSTFLYRMIFSNLWLFKGVLDGICKKSGGELNALMRTTVAFTQMSGSKAPNVIPPAVSMTANIRINPAERSEDVLAHFKAHAGNEAIEYCITDCSEPAPVSRTDVIGWERVKNAVADTWKGCLVSPYLMVQCSDSRHYGRISDRVYRFSAMDLTKEERGTIHGNNERIRTDCAARACEFYLRLMKQC